MSLNADLVMTALKGALSFLAALVLLGNLASGADHLPRNEIANCGIVIDAAAPPPSRVIAIKSTSTEMLLALGLRDRIIGHAFQDGPPASAWKLEYDAIPVVSDRLPSAEVVLSLSPDFVLAGWESNFSGEGVGEREFLAGVGIRTYVSPAACRGAADKPIRLRFEDVFNQIDELGRIFGVPERAAALVTAQRRLLAENPAVHFREDAAWYSSGTTTPYVGAGAGAPQMILDALGLRNIAGGIDDSWASMSWEAIAAADPDVLVLVDAVWNTAASKIERLESGPVTSTMRAVREKRYLIVPFAASEAGVRSVEALVSLRQQLLALPR